MDDAAAELVRCDLCGRPVLEVEEGRRSLFLEVTQEEPWRLVNGAFCTQAHAAEWLARPLPEEPPRVAVPSLTPRERLYSVALGLGVVWTLGLAGLGAYALVRLLGGWD